MDFKVPTTVYQDLQIIQELIGDLPPPAPPKAPSPAPVSRPRASSIASSDRSDVDSEEEVVANILGGRLDSDDDDESSPSGPGPSLKSGEGDSSSSSDSDSDSDDEPRPTRPSQIDDLTMDYDEDGGGVVSPDQVKTKNEIADVQVVVPEVEKLEEHEVEMLQKVGDVLNIIDKVVIVKGILQHLRGRESDRALDSDTLLVFEDGRVLGYIWETFGPTAEPFYRVQFSDAYPLDSEKIQIGRPVFHLPGRSKFISISALKHLRGSDASNAHDEEPADDELEFSDDEAERDHKRTLKDRRAGNDPASRHTTPVPSRSKDSDIPDDLYGMSPYEDSYNDMDFGAGPSRPAPMPYDDPYSDSYGLPASASLVPEVKREQVRREQVITPEPMHVDRPQRGRGRGRGAPRDAPSRGRGRGRGQDRRKDGWERGRGRGGGGGGGGDHWGAQSSHSRTNSTDEYDPRASRPLSPTSMAIARATGQYSDSGGYMAASQDMGGYPQGAANAGWGYQQYPSHFGDGYGYQQPYAQQSYVQPHINPRFASAFGMGMGHIPSGQFQGYPQYTAGYAPPGTGAMSGEWENWTSGVSGDASQASHPESSLKKEPE